MLGAYAGWGARRRDPVLDLALLRRTAAVSMLLCALASVVTFAAIFLVPVFVQSVQGHSPLATGLALLPQDVITGLGTVLGQRLPDRVSVRATVLAGFAVLAVTSAGLLLIGAHTPLSVTAVILAGRPAAVGLVITPLLFATTQQLDPGQLADANTTFNILQRIAGSLGIALIAASVTALARSHGPVSALHTTGLILAGLAATAAGLAILLPVTRHQPSAPAANAA